MRSTVRFLATGAVCAFVLVVFAPTSLQSGGTGPATPQPALESIAFPENQIRGVPVTRFMTPDGRRDPKTGQPVIPPSVAKAPAGDPDDIYWDNSISPSILGVDGRISASTVYDNKLIVGGSFTIAGSVFANNIAAWDGSSWSPLGSGMNHRVSALAVYDGKLIAGGDFTSAGGTEANGIAAWDGSSWSALGSGMDSTVRALTVYDGDLIAGGDFDSAGGVTTRRIAAWDGVSWSSLGSGIAAYYLRLSFPPGWERSWLNGVTVFDGRLIVGGQFDSVGGVAARNVAAWDGSSWSPIGSGVASFVTELTVFGGELIAGYVYSGLGYVGGDVLAWDGMAWSSLGGNGAVSALSIYDGGLVVSSLRADMGWAEPKVETWDGSLWSTIASSYVLALGVYNGKLVAGGSFNEIGGKPAQNVASWDGHSWSPLGSGISGPTVNALTVFDGRLVAGGDCGIRVGGDVTGRNIIAWDGLSLTPLASAMAYLSGDGGSSPHLKALAVYDSRLVAAGLFTVVDGVAAYYVATWDGTSWSALGDFASYYYFGSDAVTVYDGNLIATGHGLSGNYHVLAWDGSSWSVLNAGIPLGNEAALAIYDGCLVAGALSMGGLPYVASWNGSTWTPLGTGIWSGYTPPYLRALVEYDGKLIAGGYFKTIGGVEANHIAAWDGNAWSPLGSGMAGSYSRGFVPNVQSLTVYNDLLIAGGKFDTAGGIAASNIAAWDGTSWHPLGSGTRGDVNALAVYENKLVAGGEFTLAGGKVSAYLASWDKCDCGLLGDVNNDGARNLIDAVYLINHVFRSGPAPPREFWCPAVNRGDFSCDGAVNPLDIVKLINYLFRQPAPEPCDPCAR